MTKKCDTYCWNCNLRVLNRKNAFFVANLQVRKNVFYIPKLQKYSKNPAQEMIFIVIWSSFKQLLSKQESRERKRRPCKKKLHYFSQQFDTLLLETFSFLLFSYSVIFWFLHKVFDIFSSTFYASYLLIKKLYIGKQ